MTQQHCELIWEYVRLRGDLQAVLNLPSGVTAGKQLQSTVDYLRNRLMEIEQQLREWRSA